MKLLLTGTPVSPSRAIAVPAASGISPLAAARCSTSFLPSQRQRQHDDLDPQRPRPSGGCG